MRCYKAKLNMLLLRTVVYCQGGLQWSLTAYNVNLLFTSAVTWASVCLCAILIFCFMVPNVLTGPKTDELFEKILKGKGRLHRVQKMIIVGAFDFETFLRIQINVTPRRAFVNHPLVFLNCVFRVNSYQQAPVLLKERNTTIVPQITTEPGEHSLEREKMPGAQHKNLVTTLTLAFPILILTLTPPVHLWQPLDHQTSFYTLHFSTFTLWHRGTMKYRLPFSLECKHAYTVACFDVFMIAFSETWFSFLFLIPLDHNNMLSWKWESLRDNNPGEKIWIQGVLLLPQVLERIIWAGG